MSAQSPIQPALTFQGERRFWEGLREGSLEVVKTFEASGGDLTIISDAGLNVLMTLASQEEIDNGHIKIVEYLKGRVNLNERNNDGDTALHILARMGERHCLNLGDPLVRAGAATNIPNLYGETYQSIVIRG